MRSILFFFILFSATRVFGQTQADWIQHNGAYTTDRGTSITVDKQSNVFVTGIFTDTLFINNQTYYGNGFLDSYVAKMDSNGNYIWIQTVNGAKDDQAERIIALPNGDVVVAGTFADSVQIGSLKTFAQANDDVWLARLNGNTGTPLWLISAGSYYSYERVGGLAANANNIYWAINFGSDLIIGNDTITATGFNDALVTTLDFNGNILSTQTLSGSGNDNITDIACDEAGHVYVGGRFNGSFHNATAVGGFDLFYGKLYNGNLSWIKTYGGWGSEAVTAIAYKSNNIYLAGIFVDTLQLADSLLLPDDVWSDQVFIMSIDTAGNSNWFFVGFPDSGADYISDIAIACNGDLLFTGLTTYFANQNPQFPKQHDKNSNKKRCQFGDTYIARMNDQGQLLWLKNTLGTNLNSGLGIASDSSGHVYVIGYFTDSLYLANTAIKGRGGNDNFLFRIQSNVSCIQEDTTIIINVPMAQRNRAKIYPNPSNGNSYILLNGSRSAQLTLTDVTGKTLEEIIVNDSLVSLKHAFSLTAPGLYFITVKQNGMVETLKWTVTD